MWTASPTAFCLAPPALAIPSEGRRGDLLLIRPRSSSSRRNRGLSGQFVRRLSASCRPRELCIVRSTVVILMEESWLLWIARTTEAVRVGTTRGVEVQGRATLAARWCLPRVRWILRNPVLLFTPLTRSVNFPCTRTHPRSKHITHIVYEMARTR
jgi:hypothetical protein